MSTVIVWLLISMSTGHSNYGNTTVIGKFLTEEDCQSVAKKLPGFQNDAISRCVEAKIIKDWK